MCNYDTILVTEWMINDGVGLDSEWQLVMTGCNGGRSGSCPACWCCISILANSDLKTKTIAAVLFRYDVLLVALQSLCHRTPTRVTISVLHVLTSFARKSPG